MTTNKLLGIEIKSQTKGTILEKIKKYRAKPTGFFQIVSINPENLVVAQDNDLFKKVIETAQIQIIDGVGIVLAARIHRVMVEDRLTGVDMMTELVDWAAKERLRVLLIGGRPNLALELSKCYQVKYPEAKFLGLTGIEDIKNPKPDEEDKIFSIVADYKPHLLFAAFGSPDQELWLYGHKDRLDNLIVMGVGGSFDYLGGRVFRAPAVFRSLGGEWLFRLLTQPWRWRRQLRLIKFVWLVFVQSFKLVRPS